MSDLISRQDAINELNKEYHGMLSDESMKIYQIKNWLSALPSAPEPSRQRGEWIFNPKDAIELMFTKPKCSKCGFESADGGNFCGNCGARMRGEEE